METTINNSNMLIKYLPCSIAILALLSRSSNASILKNSLNVGVDVDLDLDLDLDPQQGLISFPIIPHHVQRRRLGLDDSEALAAEEQLRNHNSHNYHNNHLRKLSNTNNDATSKEIMAGLYMGYGTHYVDLYCGSPPQRQTVIVDTGSSQTAFPCSECQDCGADKYHTGPLFDETKSSSFVASDCENCSMRSTCNEETDRCDIEQYYSEGSYWTAYEAMDTCYMGGYHNKPILEVRQTVMWYYYYYYYHE